MKRFIRPTRRPTYTSSPAAPSGDPWHFSGSGLVRRAEPDDRWARYEGWPIGRLGVRDGLRNGFQHCARPPRRRASRMPESRPVIIPGGEVIAPSMVIPLSSNGTIGLDSPDVQPRAASWLIPSIGDRRPRSRSVVMSDFPARSGHDRSLGQRHSDGCRKTLAQRSHGRLIPGPWPNSG